MEKIKLGITRFLEVLKLLFPKGKQEWLLFLAFTLLYLSYGLAITLQTYVIDWPHPFRTDMYLYLDPNAYYLQGYPRMSGHPLMFVFSKPFLIFGDLLIELFGYKSKGVFLIILTSTLVSSSIVYVYRYLVEIAEIAGRVAVALTIFYGFFSTSLILAFTPESFTISLCLLSFMTYVYSRQLKANQNISICAASIFSLIAGGVTITNFAKGLAPLWIGKRSLKRKLLSIVLTSAVFFLILIAINFKYSIFSLAIAHYQEDAKVGMSVLLHLRQFVESFLASPIFFTKMKISEVYFGNVELSLFHSLWQYLVLLIIMIGIVAPLVRLWKNKFVRILFLVLLCDIVLHFCLQFGLHEGFIYGGHWVFLVPLFFGWLYKSLKENKHRRVFLFAISGLILFLIINNGWWMYDFYNYIIIQFPSVLP